MKAELGLSLYKILQVLSVTLFEKTPLIQEFSYFDTDIPEYAPDIQLVESCCPRSATIPCSWLYLVSHTSAKHFCQEPGHPYCPGHQREMDALAQADQDWDEILATLKGFCEEPTED